MKSKVGTFAPDGTMLPPKRKTRSDKGKPRKQKGPVKKRHRRTKAELLQDPEYCKKHGIKRVKLQKVATTRMKKPVKAAVSAPKKEEKAANEPKKRRRRTKAELLQDPVYRKKHGLDAPKITDIARVPAMKKGNDGKTIAKIEEEHLIRAYHEWEKVQGVINGMDAALSAVLRRSDPKPREFIAFDHAAGAMEDAFAAFETAIDERREME